MGIGWEYGSTHCIEHNAESRLKLKPWEADEIGKYLVIIKLPQKLKLLH
jgi:hypothetical protein